MWILKVTMGLMPNNCVIPIWYMDHKPLQGSFGPQGWDDGDAGEPSKNGGNCYKPQLQSESCEQQFEQQGAQACLPPKRNQWMTSPKWTRVKHLLGCQLG